MSVRTDVINLNVNVNGNKAQNELNQLRKRAADVKFEMDGLKKGTQAYVEKKKELAGITAEMARLKQQIGITSLNQKELINELNRMKALRANMQPFTDEFKKMSKEIKNVENRLYDVRNGVQGFASFFSKIKDEVKQFGLVAASYLGFQFISSQFSNIIRGAGKTSDTLADLQRVTGMTAEEVEGLNNALKELDTRTSVQGLREISVIAGRLGVAKEDLFGFTKAVDQLVVSLGDSLGDADQITSQLGKILNVFDGKITGDNITRLGNAFVELDQSGSATAGFMADFDQRLSGIAKSANIGLGELTGLGAGLEELGGRVESSATAVQKLIISIASDIPAAAKISGKSLADFNEIFSTNAIEALLLYAEGLTKNKTSFSQVTASFADAGEEGARVIETLSKLGQSSDFLRGRIDMGKKSIQESTAITEAFQLKNETFGATLDKLGKEFNRLVASPAVTGFLQSAVNGALRFIEVIRGIPKFIQDNKVALLTLAAGVVLLNKQYILSALAVMRDSVAKVANTLITKGSAIATNLAITAQAAYITVTNALTGRITIATAAQRLWNVAMSLGASGLGAILVVAGGLFLAIRNLISGNRELSAQQKANAEVAKRASEIYTDQVTRLEILKKNITSTSSTLEQKKKAYDELIGIHPEFANTLKLDAEGHLQGAGAIDVYIDKLKKKAEAEAKYSVLIDKLKEKQNLFNELRSRNEEFKGMTDQQLEDYFKKVSKESVGFFAGVDKKLRVGFAEGVVEKLEVIKTLQEEIANFSLDSGTPGAPPPPPPPPLPPPGDDKKDKKKDKLEDLKKEAEEFAKELKRIRREVDINGMQADAAEVARIEDKYKELLQKAKKYNFELLAIDKMKQDELQQLFDKIMKKQQEEKKKKNEDDQKKETEALEKGIDERFKRWDDGRKKKKEQEEKDAEDKKKQEEEDLQAFQERVDRILEYAQLFRSVLQSLANYANALENRTLARDKKINDERKKNLKKLLDDKLISEGQYNMRLAQMDEEFDKKQAEIKRRQAKREKALNIFESLISTFAAVAEALPDIPLSIAVGIAGAVQTALIAATPLPEFGAGDWIRKGDKHSDRSGGIPIKVERDEAVMSAASMNNKKIYSVTGNTAQITSALNSTAGGANWAGGAKVVEMAAWRTEKSATINPNLPAIMEQGGIVRNIAGNTNAYSGSMEQLLRELIAEQKANTEAIKTINTELHAVVSIKEFRRKEEEYEAAKKASGLNS